MSAMSPAVLGSRLFLDAETAAGLMRPNPVSVAADATVQEALAVLTDKGFSGAPVIDAAGRPVGVLSRTDLLVHDREKVDYAGVPGEDTVADPYPPSAWARRPGFQEVRVDRTRVSEVMTPVVFSVKPEAPAAEVVRQMLELKVHRLFVADEGGVLVGVISAFDILQHLRP